MGKPKNEVYNAFIKEFERINAKSGKEQYIVPYLMSSHPGSTLADAIVLAEYICKMGYMPEQVQDYYPTPGTVSTCMYYTGLDPVTMEQVYVATDPHEKAMQRALIQYRDPKNYDLVKEALLKCHREDLIGFGRQYLIPPRKMNPSGQKTRHPAAGRTSASSRNNTAARQHGSAQSRTTQHPAAKHPAAKPANAQKSPRRTARRGRK